MRHNFQGYFILGLNGELSPTDSRVIATDSITAISCYQWYHFGINCQIIGITLVIVAKSLVSLWYQLPNHWYQLVSLWYQLPNHWYQLVSLWYQLPNHWLQLKKSQKFPTTSLDFFSRYKITYERLQRLNREING